MLKVWIHRVVDMPVPLLMSHQLEGVMVQGRNLGGWRPSGGLELTGEHKWWNIYSVGHDTLECQADSRNQSSSSPCILILLTTVDKHSNVMLVYFSWENTQTKFKCHYNSAKPYMTACRPAYIILSCPKRLNYIIQISI